MDCEIFDKLVIDRIFAELDDLASGAVQRHVAHCSRCRSIESSLRATREVATLPLVDPEAEFVDQVLALEKATRTQLPFRQRLGRAVSVLAGYAMRPQLGMSALLLLMIGSSLFLIRVHPGEHELVQVTERGVPEDEVEVHPTSASKASVQLGTTLGTTLGAATRESAIPKADTATAAEGTSTLAMLDAARKAYAEERYGECHQLAENVIRLGGTETGAAALLSALALAKQSGCSSALARFEALRARHGRSALGEEAAYHAAECHLEVGNADRARALYQQLKGSATWGERARQRLHDIPEPHVDPAESLDGGTPRPTP